MSIEKLKPCPFCGGKAIIVTNFSGSVPTHRVRCTSCNAMMGSPNVTYDGNGPMFFEIIDDAVQAWNMRNEEIMFIAGRRSGKSAAQLEAIKKRLEE